MKNLPLAHLKSLCVTAGLISRKHPKSQLLIIAYKKAKRAVEAEERRMFCTVKEQ